jgi:hypothetical protein
MNNHVFNCPFLCIIFISTDSWCSKFVRCNLNGSCFCHICVNTSGSSMFCLLTRFHLLNSHGLLVITMKCNAKCRFCIAAILFCITSSCNEIMVMLHDMTKQCADRGLHVLVAGRTNSADR